jgi:putative Ca2+/H+ antiporter (TMEM165/GDT1 family)
MYNTLGGTKMETLFTSFFLVFASEMGDKSQLMSIAFASLFKARTVLVSVLIAALINNGIAVLFGSYMGEHIPNFYMKFLAALLFLFFGVFSLSHKESENGKIITSHYPPLLTIIITYVLSEFGDKTQLTTIALTASYRQPFYILLGTTLGMFMADVIGIIIGFYFNKKISHNYLKYISSAVFIAFAFSLLYKLFYK